MRVCCTTRQHLSDLPTWIHRWVATLPSKLRFFFSRLSTGHAASPSPQLPPSPDAAISRALRLRRRGLSILVANGVLPPGAFCSDCSPEGRHEGGRAARRSQSTGKVKQGFSEADQWAK